MGVLSLAVGNALAGPGNKCAAKDQASCARQMGLQDLRQLNLTADQKAKLAELRKEYRPKFKEIHQAKQSVLTPAQKQAREEVLSAAKAARAAGKKPGNVRKAVAAAVNLTADQQAKMAKLDKAAATLRAELREKALAILTPDQVAELKQLKKARHHKAQPASGSQPAPAGQAPAGQAPAGQ
jgi:Spy/CpxP family protein refolding chaperone